MIKQAAEISASLLASLPTLTHTPGVSGRPCFRHRGDTLRRHRRIV